MATAVFLRKFQELEKKLKRIAHADDTQKFPQVVSEVSKRNGYIARKRDVLYDLNQLRNVFAHQQRGKYIAEVGPAAMDEIGRILKTLANPPTAGEVFKTNVFVAQVHDRIEDVLKEMHAHIYTHVPVYGADKQYKGTFSETSLLDWLVDYIRGGIAEFGKLHMGDINRKYLHSPSNRVEFINADMSVFEVEALFAQYIKKGERLGAIFVTNTGACDGQYPIGIATAWDLSRIEHSISE